MRSITTTATSCNRRATASSPCSVRLSPMKTIRSERSMRRYEDRLRSRGRAPIQIRIGINTGEVVVREVHTGAHPEYTPIGHTANLASRLQHLARGGSIVVSEPTAILGFLDKAANVPSKR